MIRLLREFRLIPVLLIAAGCLFALKLVGLLLDGGYLLGSRTLKNDSIITLSLEPTAQQLEPQTIPLDNSANKSSWMSRMFGYPESGSVNTANSPSKYSLDITGSTAAPKPAAKDETPSDKSGPAAAAKTPPPPPPGIVVPLDNVRSMSPAERAILERLHERRQELDARARELDIRETLLKEGEKKLDARMNELKELEAKGALPGQNKDGTDTPRLKSLATMYENMKAKEAAKIFDRLDMKVLIEMAMQINPRRMSEILAQMNPEVAEKLTLELAARATGGEKSANPANLPKIEGRPNGS